VIYKRAKPAFHINLKQMLRGTSKAIDFEGTLLRVRIV